MIYNLIARILAIFYFTILRYLDMKYKLLSAGVYALYYKLHVARHLRSILVRSIRVCIYSLLLLYSVYIIK